MDSVIDGEFRAATLELVHFMRWHGTIYADDEVWHAFENAMRRADFASGVQAQAVSRKWEVMRRELGAPK